MFLLKQVLLAMKIIPNTRWIIIVPFQFFFNKVGLCIPSKAVFEVCQYAEKLFRASIAEGGLNKKKIATLIKNNLSNFFSDKLSIFLPIHLICSDEIHEIELILKKSEFYINIRVRSQAMQETLDSW